MAGPQFAPAARRVRMVRCIAVLGETLHPSRTGAGLLALAVVAMLAAIVALARGEAIVQSDTIVQPSA